MDDAYTRADSLQFYEQGALYIRPGASHGRVFVGEVNGVVTYLGGELMNRRLTMPLASWNSWAKDAVKVKRSDNA